MQTDQRRRISRRLPGLVVVVSLASLMVPAWARSQAIQDKPTDPTPSSYDQIAPVLLGKESFPGRDGQGQGRQGGGHGPAEEAAGGALRPHAAARRQGDDVARQADPGRPDGEAAGGDDLGASWPAMSQRRDPRQGPVPQGLSAAAPPQARGRRHGLSPDGDQAAAAPGALRPRFRLARALPARVPAGHLPDDAARPGRRVAGQGGDRRQLPGDLRAAS